jgi:DNA polymerase-4
MDAFFVNVHRLDHPEDRGIPLVVGGRPESRGVVAAASYEARKFGVRSAMPTSTALRLCPELKIVGHTWSRIHACSQQVMAVLTGYGDVEQLSVDEAFVDLSACEDPTKLAPAIRERVKQETQLPASVGLATNKLVAKVASDQGKPEGCMIVLPGEEAAFLAPLPVRVIWGIGPRTADRLADMGIHTCGDLAIYDRALLQKRFGKQAEEMQRRAEGIDKRPVHPERGPAKSISQEWTFSRDVRDEALLDRQLRKMCAAVAESLQEHGLVAHTINVKLRWPDFTTITRQKTVEIGVQQEGELYRLAHAIWRENWSAGQPVRLLGVGASRLGPVVGRQLSFEF